MPLVSGEHCLHQQSTLESLICCRCGLLGLRKTVYEWEPLPGHGPFGPQRQVFRFEDTIANVPCH